MIVTEGAWRAILTTQKGMTATRELVQAGRKEIVLEPAEARGERNQAASPDEAEGKKAESRIVTI